MEYADPGDACYEERYRQRVLNDLTRRAESVGYVLRANQPHGSSFPRSGTLKLRKWRILWFFEPPGPDAPAPRPARHTAD
jgi:hypothetical protein